MSRKRSGRARRLDRDRRATLADWLKKFTPEAIIEAVNDLEPGIEKREPGRPADHPANLAAVFDFIEPRRKRGEKLKHICDRLAENYKKFTTNCHPTSGGLEGMYYRAKSDKRRQAGAGHYWRFGDVVLPILFVEKPGGVLESCQLDTSAVPPDAELFGPRTPGWDVLLLESDTRSATMIKRPSRARSG